jgi:hypothetical protein
MNREHSENEFIELGAATKETRGGPIGFVDAERTLQPYPGLSDD